tara:strand:+ start:701 stop:1090 length:390 start_codon:yes stop_codon:yes gene_type:complete
MKNIRCNGCSYVKNAYLDNYALSFCHPEPDNIYGYANVYKKKGSRVPGAIWKITKEHEQTLDIYEEYPKSYKKHYFNLDGNKTMFYIMETCSFKKPSQRYINVIKEGYQDCNLDLTYLERKISNYNMKL